MAPLSGSLGLRDSTHGRAEGSELLVQVWLSPQMAETCTGLFKLELVWSCWMSNSPLGRVQADEQHLAWLTGT